MVLKGNINLVSLGIKAMLLLQVVIMAFWKAEDGRAVFHGTQERPPVSSPMFLHSFHQVELHLAIRAGMFFFTGWRAVDLQVLDQCLFSMIPPATGLTVVGKLLVATGDLIHVHHVAAGQMLATFLAHVVGFSPVHPEVPPQCLRGSKVLLPHVAVKGMLWRLGNFKWHVPRCSSSGGKRRG